MSKLYKETYFNRRNWILANFDKLNITNDELVLILLIDYCKEFRIRISYEYFMDKLHLDSKQVDEIIASLVSKKYLKISPNSKGISFDIDNVFEFDADVYEIAEHNDIYDILSEVFARPLSGLELQKASDLIEKYGTNKFTDALRIAEAYRKLNMNYISSILKNNENK